jgi:hypothetical protein
MHQQQDAGVHDAIARPLRSDPDQLIDTARFAQLACLSECYARQLRVMGGGPRFIKLTQKTVRYRIGDVLDWISSRPIVSSTSELEAAQAR